MKKQIVIILLLLVCGLYAANEINYSDTTGQERYARTVRPSDGYIWDTDAVDWAAAPDWNDTSIDLTEDAQVRGLYQVNYPAGITDAGVYFVFVYDGNDTDASNSDTKLGWGEIDWSGTAEVTLVEVRADTNELQTNIFLAAIADAVLDELLTSHTDVNSLGEILQFINDVIEGDSQIVTSGTPWQKLVEIKGTATELIRKDLKDIDGNDLSSIYTIIGQEVEP